MDSLCQLKDGVYNVNIAFNESRLKDYFKNVISVEIAVEGLKEENALKYLNEIYGVIHQMLNNYYDETGHEIYFILYDYELEHWDYEHILEFHIAPISELKNHNRKFSLMRKSDMNPIIVDPSKKYSKDVIRLTESKNLEVFTMDDISDINDVLKDIIDEYNLENPLNLKSQDDVITSNCCVLCLYNDNDMYFYNDIKGNELINYIQVSFSLQQNFLEEIIPDIINLNERIHIMGFDTKVVKGSKNSSVPNVINYYIIIKKI